MTTNCEVRLIKNLIIITAECFKLWAVRSFSPGYSKKSCWKSLKSVIVINDFVDICIPNFIKDILSCVNRPRKKKL